MNVRLASVALQRWMSRCWTSQVHQPTCYHGSWGTWLVLNKLHISNKYLDKRSEREFLTKNFPQHHCRHCHLQRHQNGLLAFPFSHMVADFWVSFFSYTFARYGVYMFITPLLLLPLLASSYAEVNYEGVKCIQVLAVDIPSGFVPSFSEYPSHREEGPHVPVPLWSSHPDDSLRPCNLLWHNW